MSGEDKNSSELDYENQECKDCFCEWNENGACTKDEEDYDNCPHKTGD